MPAKEHAERAAAEIRRYQAAGRFERTVDEIIAEACAATALEVERGGVLSAARRIALAAEAIAEDEAGTSGLNEELRASLEELRATMETF